MKVKQLPPTPNAEPLTISSQDIVWDKDFNAGS